MSCSISAVDSVEGSPDFTTSLTSECSTAAAPSGSATGSAGATVTAAGSAANGAAGDVSCASAAARIVAGVFTVAVVLSGAGVAAVADCPAEITSPGFSLSENILRPPRGPALLPGKKLRGELPNHGASARKEM